MIGTLISIVLLPLLVLISIAAFLPVSEIAQVGRQLADTIASTRRLHVVHSEPVLITVIVVLIIVYIIADLLGVVAPLRL